MRVPAVPAIVGLVLAVSSALFAQEPDGVRPLLVVERNKLRAILPSETHLLVEPVAIERFLNELDGAPPDWTKVYGLGHRDPGHDDRLFALNRERDAGRAGKPALQKLVTFLWLGELSGFEPQTDGFRLALGPKLHRTRWGIVRFKPENLPSNLTAIPNPALRESLRRRFVKGQRIEVEMAMTGRLIQEESLIYDFSHEEEGQGLIMPVVRIERVDYLLMR